MVKNGMGMSNIRILPCRRLSGRMVSEEVGPDFEDAFLNLTGPVVVRQAGHMRIGREE